MKKKPREQVVQRRKGAEGFESYYSELYPDRWQRLRELFLDTTQLPGEGRVVRRSAFGGQAEAEAAFADATAAELRDCYLFERNVSWDQRDAAGLRLAYVMDQASVAAARALPLAEAEHVLDLCAAPGGKSLILAEGLGPQARLFVNDRSPARKRRLEQVLADYLPPALRQRVSVTNHDGRRVGVARPEAFDAVLLDAPCSSESHVLADPKALAQWSSGRVDRLSKDQYALVTAALGALRPGGHLLYSTCALAPKENDGVLQRLLDRKRHPAEVRPLDASLGSKTELGVQILPDAAGCGPIYYSLLRKL